MLIPHLDNNNTIIMISVVTQQREQLYISKSKRTRGGGETAQYNTVSLVGVKRPLYSSEHVLLLFEVNERKEGEQL